MGIFSDPMRNLFEMTTDIDPRSINEYNSLIGAAAEEALKPFGVSEVRYRVSIPKIINLDPALREENILFGRGENIGETPVSFGYKCLEKDDICFEAYAEKGGGFGAEELYSIEIIFRQLYYILSTFILRTLGRTVTEKDVSTGIDNVESFMRFCGELLSSGRAKDYTALYFNIHNFKSIHRSLTYTEGNRVMTQYCGLVSRSLTENELVARFGSDNFVAVVLDSHRDYFFDLLQNMVVKYNKDGEELIFLFGATIGAAKLDIEKNPGEIMMHISSAYQAAREKKLPFSYYDHKISDAILAQKIILSQFHNSVRKREFFVVYQPKVGVRSRTLRGAEALVRWSHDGGYILPGNFIPALEKDGCICTLDFYVLEEVCIFQKKLMEKGIEPVKISVNFSKRHLSNNKLVEEIVEVVDKYGIPHCYIEIELTESEDYHNQGVMKEIVDELNVHGIKTSIDDFGTGYSSLEMLRTLSLDALKIDRSFIPQDENAAGNRSMIMLKGVVSLAKNLGLTIVAEGVETDPQLKLIEEMNCDMVQGYIFDKPLPEEEFIKRLLRKSYER